MHWFGKSLFIATILLSFRADADALCMYDGKHFIRSKREDGEIGLYATTTLTDEFLDSALVIRGFVISTQDHSTPDAYSIYRIRVDQVFKGKSLGEVLDFTEHDSAGFYLDTGKEYLLFLNPMTKDDDARKIAPGAMRVNYSCGQSQPWANLSAKDRIALHSLAAGKP